MQGETAPAHTYYYPDYAINQGEAEGLDLSRMFRLLWKRKHWLLVALILGWAAGWVASRMVAPEYSTSTTLAIQDRGTRQGGPIQTGQVLPVDGWTDVFTSRAVVAPVVERMKLQLRIVSKDVDDALFDSMVIGEDVTPGDYTLRVRPQGAWELLRADASGGPVERGTAGQVIGAASGFEWTPDLSGVPAGEEIEFRLAGRQGAILELVGRLEADFRNRSDIITATLSWHDPQQAADILNEVAAEFVDLANRLRTTKIREEITMLQEQVDTTEALLERSQFALEAQRVSAITEPTDPLIGASPTGMGATGAADPVFSAFSQTRVRADQLSFQRSQIQEIRAQLANGGNLNLLALQFIPSVSQSSDLQSAITQLQSLRNSRRTLLFTYTEEEPSVVQTTTQIDELEGRVIPQLLADLDTEIAGQIDLLNRQIAAQGEQLRQVPQRTIQTQRLMRDMTQAASLHGSILSRLKEAELAEATAGPGITVLNAAWPNPTPRGEKPASVIALFAALGLGIGIAGVIVFDRFDRRIHSPDQVTGSLGLPVLAVVPRLQAAPDPTSPAAAIAVESFRGLRTQIAHVDGKTNGVMLITSPAPREGKSMVSANLAISYATAGHRTLLLDGDTRRGRAQEMFNLDRSPGLTDYLMERATLDEIRQHTGVENLTLIARGAPGGFNADLLEGARMRAMLTQMREEYDVIVVDGPPLAAGADVLLLGAFVDKVVLVVRAGTTTEDLAKAKLEALGNVDLPIVGAVLNALPKSAPEYEYYVHYYYADAEAV